ncbi:LuxR C-terminal-related transcriptional regulator [bacterium]|nr:LuxR C-terminal-related transcriptional regulator [bacterium]
MLAFNMSSYFVKTKLLIPTLRSKLVERNGLLDQLTGGYQQQHRLLLISAPAGYGKTTLARAWIEEVHTATAWYTVEPEDDRPGAFIHYLVKAVCQALPDCRDALQGDLDATPAAEMDSLLPQMVNQITASDQPLVIVLDDYHQAESSQTNQILTFLLDHLPPNATLLLTTRTTPELPLARLRARDQLTEITAGDLRFNGDEISAFFEINCGAAPSPQMLSALMEKTEGWVAALQLLSQDLRENEDTAGILDRFTGQHPFVRRYLIDEVFAMQPKDLQGFLLRLSALEKINLDLAANVLEMDHKTALANFRMLKQRNLFLFPVNKEQTWFQFHPLFQDVLRQRGKETGNGETRRLHARASAWFEAHGMIEEAIAHAFEANGDGRTAELIENNAEKMLLTGKYDRFLQFVRQLLPQYKQNAPILLVYQATAMLFSGYATPKVLKVLTQAESCADDGTLDGEIGAVRAIIRSYTSDPVDAISEAKRSLSEIDSANIYFSNLIERNLGMAYLMMHDLTRATPWFKRLLVSSAALEDHDGTLAAYHYLTSIQQVQGRLSEANENFVKALAFIDTHQLQNTPHGIMIFSGFGNLLLHRNQLRKAKQTLRYAIQLANEGDPSQGQAAYHYLSEVFLMENDTRSALTTIQKVRQLSQGIQDSYQDNQDSYSLALEARIHLDNGREKQAIQWLETSGLDYLDPDELVTQYGFETGQILAVAARAYLVKGDPEKGLDLLQGILAEFREQEADACLINAFATMAVIHNAIGEEMIADDLLDAALDLAEPEGNLGDFHIAGQALIPLLKRAETNRRNPAFIRKVLGVFDVSDPDTTAQSKDLEEVDPLSRREMDVLLLIAEGMTNKEISRKLFLSTNTIKSHSVKIYRKLNVNNRGQAVAKARLLGLLPMHPTNPR